MLFHGFYFAFPKLLMTLGLCSYWLSFYYSKLPFISFPHFNNIF